MGGLTQEEADVVKELANEAIERRKAERRQEASTGDSLVVKMGRGLFMRVKPEWIPAIVTAIGLGGTVAYQHATPATATPMAIEARLGSVEGEQRGIRDAVASLERRFLARELRQTYQWAWEAEKAGDKARADAMRDEASRLSRELGGEKQ